MAVRWQSLSTGEQEERNREGKEPMEKRSAHGASEDALPPNHMQRRVGQSKRQDRRKGSDVGIRRQGKARGREEGKREGEGDGLIAHEALLYLSRVAADASRLRYSPDQEPSANFL